MANTGYKKPTKTSQLLNNGVAWNNPDNIITGSGSSAVTTASKTNTAFLIGEGYNFDSISKFCRVDEMTIQFENQHSGTADSNAGILCTLKDKVDPIAAEYFTLSTAWGSSTRTLRTLSKTDNGSSAKFNLDLTPSKIKNLKLAHINASSVARTFYLYNLMANLIYTNPTFSNISTYTGTLTSVSNPNYNALPIPTGVNLNETFEVPIKMDVAIYQQEEVVLDVTIPKAFKLIGFSFHHIDNSIFKDYSVDNINNEIKFRLQDSIINAYKNVTTTYSKRFNVTLHLKSKGNTPNNNLRQLNITELTTKTAATINLPNVPTSTINAKGSKITLKNKSTAKIFDGVLLFTAKGSKITLKNKSVAKIEETYPYLGPIRLESGHQREGLKNKTTNTLIEDVYKNRGNYGKKGDYDEDIPLTLILDNKHEATIQGLVELDEPIPIDTCPKCRSTSVLNHRGYGVLYSVQSEELNTSKTLFEIGVKYLSRNLDLPIFINRLSKINNYDLKGLYPITTLETGSNIKNYFKITGNYDLFTGNTTNLTSNQNIIMLNQNVLSKPSQLQMEWSANFGVNQDKISRYIRVRNENNEVVFEYELYDFNNINGAIRASVSSSEGTDDYLIYTMVKTTDSETIETITSDENEFKIEGTKLAYGFKTAISFDNDSITIIEEGRSENELYLERIYLTGKNHKLEFETLTRSGASITSYDISVDETYLLNNKPAYLVNQIVSPFPLTNRELLFYRESEDGLLYYYNQEEGEFKYSAQPGMIYKGGTDIRTLEGTSLLNTRFKTDPLVITNGLVKLTVSKKLKYINVQLFDNDKWEFITSFKLGKIENVGIDYISSDKAQISISGTKWTIWRGRPFIQIEHANEDLIIANNSNFNEYQHDNGNGSEISTPITEMGQELIFNKLYYIKIHETTSDYGLQVIRPDYKNINANKMPKSLKTVIIPYKKSATVQNTPTYMALEWFNMYEQKISIGE